MEGIQTEYNKNPLEEEQRSIVGNFFSRRYHDLNFAVQDVTTTETRNSNTGDSNTINRRSTMKKHDMVRIIHKRWHWYHKNLKKYGNE